MATTKLISPGIPNYTLKRNLRLNNNYISNDGGDEGILIQDDGDMVLTSSGTATLFLKDAGGEYISGDGTDLDIVSGGNIANTAGGNFSTIGAGAIPITLAATTKTSSSSFDHTVLINEVLNLGSGEAGGSDVHYGLRYNQAQTDITGWDSVYLMHLTGGSGKTFAVDNNANLLLNDDRKVVFGDAGEYIVGDGTNLSIASSGNLAVTAGGAFSFTGSGALPMVLSGNTKTSSSVSDATVLFSEALNLGSGEAGGSDIHYGLRYLQTQIDASGWDKVYLMYLYGGDAARTFVVQGDGKVGIGVADPASPLQILSTSVAQLKISYDASSSAILTVLDDSHTTIATAESGNITLDAAGDITLDAAGKVLVDLDVDSTSAANNIGLEVDVDRVGDVSSLVDSTFGMSMNISSTGASGGTIGTFGIKLVVIGDDAGSGTSIARGMTIGVSGADTNYALTTSGGNVGIGVADPASPLEIFSTSSQLKISYDASNYSDISVASDGHLEIATTGTDADLTLDSASSIMLETTNLYVYPSSSTTQSLTFSMTGDPKLTINSQNDGGDEFSIQVNDNGATTLTTVDDDGADAHLNIEADGHVEFDNCAVGFDKLSGTFGTSAVIGSPNDGTDIDFRLGNKYDLILGDDMGSDDLLNLIFPAVSGNFILVLVHDPSGGYDIDDAAWKAYASDGSLADSELSENGTDGEVRWAGGATPTLSANGRDIDVISIYWDADLQTALAVASLDFAAV